MRKVVVTYGLLAGIVIAVLMVATGMGTNENADYSMSVLLGYATMIVALSMIYFGIRSYRNNYCGGSITFGKAFLVGLYITLIASALYVVSWKIYSTIAVPDFADRYAAHVIDDLKKSGAADSVVAIKTKEMADWKKMYANPIFEIGMTFLEIFPVGLVVSLICAAFLKRKPKVGIGAPPIS